MSPFDIMRIAKVAHEVNRVYCQSLGDNSQPAWADAPAWQQDSAINGVTAIVTGNVVAPEGSHLSWYAEKVANGWVYGEVKDPVEKTHPCLVPYDELPRAQRLKDDFFFAVVKAMTP